MVDDGVLTEGGWIVHKYREVVLTKSGNGYVMKIIGRGYMKCPSIYSPCTIGFVPLPFRRYNDSGPYDTRNQIHGVSK